MIGKGNIRIAFETAMKGIILEGNESTYLNLAQSTVPEDKDELFNTINNDLFKGKAPFGDMLEMKSFSQGGLDKVLKYLLKDKKSAEILFNMNPTGVGRGELMLAYIVKNMRIGGGSEDIDLTLFGKNGGTLDQAELKEAEYRTSDGFLSGWRTGAKHRPFVNQALADLKNLYNGLQSEMIELDPNTKEGANIKSKVDRGEYSGFVKVVRDIDPANIVAPLAFDIQISPTDELHITTTTGKIIGDLSKKQTLNKIRTLLSEQNVVALKSFKTIEEELVAGFGSVSEKFVFISSKGSGTKKIGKIFFKDNISGDTSETKFNSATSGTVKVMVKA